METPGWLVRFMVGLAEGVRKGGWVLEAGAHLAPFLSAFRELHGSQYRFSALDIDPAALDPPPFAERIVADFLLYQGGPFDAILANPPYGVVGHPSKYALHTLREAKPLYKNHLSSWRGRYNLYGAFLEKGVRLLRPRGVLVYVVPGSFLVLEEFRLLRLLLSQEGETEIYHLGRVFPRKKVAAVVVRFRKGVGKGLLSLYEVAGKERAVRPVFVGRKWQGEMIRFETEALLAWEKGGIPLGSLFEIRFAARSTEWKRHPLTKTQPGPGLVPILTGRNLKPGFIDYETPYSGLYFPLEHAQKVKPFYGTPHLVVAHTRSRIRPVAAWDERGYPWREEFHLIPKTQFFKIDSEALVEYLNSEEVGGALEALYRDLAKHLTRPMLSRIPIPTGFL
ncbi:MAG: TaqI-like C-terminal specificity domain-containing protein [Thermaceae bacterium]